MPRLILASGSPRRKDLLTQAGISPDLVISADIDESPLKKELPRVYTMRMAQEKARKVRLTNDSDFIISADTVVCCGRTILPKAGDSSQVKQCLKILSGRSHRVLTAVCVINPQGKESLKIISTKVAFKRLSNAEIEHYINSQEGIGKAGGYAIQGLAGCFVNNINGSYSSIVGLPLCETVNMLTGLGYAKK